MKFAPAFTFASALILMLRAGAPAVEGLEPLDPLYDVSSLDFNLYHDEKLRAELKLTKEQEKVYKAHNEIGKFGIPLEERQRFFKAGKKAELYALHRKKAEEYFAWMGKTLRPEQVKRLKQVWLQRKGIRLFGYEEIRKDLKMDEAQAKKLKEAHDKLRQHYEAEFQAGRINQKQARDLFLGQLNYGVPDKVRELLTAEQRRKLNDLLGEPYDFSKK